MSIFSKDPDAVLDYSFDWSDWLGVAETISSHLIDADTGIVVDSDSEATGVVSVWLSGGSVGETYGVRCEIETNESRTDERTMFIKVKQR